MPIVFGAVAEMAADCRNDLGNHIYAKKYFARNGANVQTNTGGQVRDDYLDGGTKYFTNHFYKRISIQALRRRSFAAL